MTDAFDFFRWSDRKVLSLVVGGSSGNWVLMTSCCRVGPDKKPATLRQAEETCLVSLQCSTSSQSIIVCGRGGALSATEGYIYLQGEATQVLSVALDGLPAPGSGAQTHVTSLSALVAMSKWMIELPAPPASGVYPSPAAHLFPIPSSSDDARCLCIITPGAVAYLVKISNREILASNKIYDGQVISANITGPTSATGSDCSVVCLSDRGALCRISFQ